MKRPDISEIVYNRQWPKPKQNEPSSWLTHVQRNLVPEVRVEVSNFYGALDSLEAQYPGLNYTFDPHRRRLARFPWHRRLFRIFDELKLTHDEILSICIWEGTKSAKDKYEQETGRHIRDTTVDGILSSAQTEPRGIIHSRLQQPSRRVSTETMAHIGTLDEQQAEAENSDDEEIHSVGAQLNQQLLAGAEGEEPEVYPPHDGPLEEWLKYMHDRDSSRDSMLQAIRAGHPPPTVLEQHVRPAVESSMAATISTGDVASYNIASETVSDMAHSPTNSYGLPEEILAHIESRVQA